MATAAKDDKDATVKELQDQITELKADFAGVADALKKLASGEVNAASHTVRQQAEKVAEKARAAAAEAKAHVADATATTRQTISDNPLTAAAIAAAAGFVIGILVRR